MRRFHLFEFEDQPWFPAPIRDCITDYLRFVANYFGLVDHVAPKLVELLEQTGRTQIVDIASGGGGGWPSIAPQLVERVPGVTVTLTDRYPNRAALEAVVAEAPEVLRFEPEPVDATDVPRRLRGLRTQFTSLHHFDTPDARRLLANAVDAGEPIAIFEMTRRDVGTLLRFLFVPIAVLLLTPKIRPFRWSRILWTYVVPVVPVIILWDGLVSVLRTYTLEEKRQLARDADPEGRFEWETGELIEDEIKIVPYLIGRPAGAASCSP